MMSRFFPFALQKTSSQLSPEISMESILIARDGQLVKTSASSQMFYENGEAAGSIMVVNSFEYQNSYHNPAGIARLQGGSDSNINSALSLSSIVEKPGGGELGKRHIEMEGRIEKRPRRHDRVDAIGAGLGRTVSPTVSPTGVDSREANKEGKDHRLHHHHERFDRFLIRGEQSPKVQPGNFSWLLHHENTTSTSTSTQAGVGNSSSDSAKQGSTSENAYWRFYKT